MASPLLARWRARASELEPYAPAAAEAFRKAADELEAIEQGDSVTLKEAQLIGGYSIDHLQRLVQRKQLANVGTKGRIRIPRSAVPIKPGHQATLREEEPTRPLKPSAVVSSAIARSAQ